MRNESDATPSTEHGWTVRALNIHGIFFERLCEQMVVTEPEWVVEHTHIPVEYPRGHRGSRERESALDLLASSHRNNTPLKLLIEAKKNNPDLVRWIFFPSTRQRRLAMRIVRASPSPAGDASEVAGSWLYAFRTDIPLTDSAREVRGDYTKAKGGDKTKTSNAAIYDAAYQVALAMQALADEDVRRTRERRSETLRWCWYVPAIVTSATLEICRFDPTSVSDESGEVPQQKVTFEPLPYLLFEFGLPPHLQTHAARAGQENPLDDEAHQLLERMPIFVVEARHFTTFLRGLNWQRSMIALQMDLRVATEVAP